jgi:hypothetical protein
MRSSVVLASVTSLSRSCSRARHVQSQSLEEQLCAGFGPERRALWRLVRAWW